MIIPGSPGCGVQIEVAPGDRCWRQGTKLRQHLTGEGEIPPTSPPAAPHTAWTIREVGSSSQNHLEQEEVDPGEPFPEISLSDSTSEYFYPFFC